METKKFKVFTYDNLPLSVPTECGSDEVDECALVYKDDGTEFVEPTGKKINIQKKIDAARESCDLSLIIDSLIDSGLVPEHVTIDDDPKKVVDTTSIDNLTIHDLYKAQANLEKNQKIINEYLEKMKAKEEKKEVKEDEQK